MPYGDDDREMYYAQRILTTYNRNRDYGSPRSDYGAWDAVIGTGLEVVGAGIQTFGTVKGQQQQQQILQQQAELEAERSQLEKMLASEETQKAIKVAGIVMGGFVLLGIGGGVLYYMSTRE